MTALHNDGQKRLRKVTESQKVISGRKVIRVTLNRQNETPTWRPRHRLLRHVHCGGNRDGLHRELYSDTGAAAGHEARACQLCHTFVLMGYGFGSAALVSLVRIIVVNSLFGNMTAVAFSLAGAALSILVMSLLKRAGAFRWWV